MNLNRATAVSMKPISLATWPTLRGAQLTAALDRQVRQGGEVTVESLRGLAVHLASLGVKLDDPGFLKWVKAHAPAALEQATPQARRQLLRQLQLSGMPAAQAAALMPRAPVSLMRTPAQREAFVERMQRQFSRDDVSSPPGGRTVIARDPAGRRAPVVLTVGARSLTLEQGQRRVKAELPARPTSASLDTAVAVLAMRLAGE